MGWEKIVVSSLGRIELGLSVIVSFVSSVVTSTMTSLRKFECSETLRFDDMDLMSPFNFPSDIEFLR